MTTENLSEFVITLERKLWNAVAEKDGGELVKKLVDHDVSSAAIVGHVTSRQDYAIRLV